MGKYKVIVVSNGAKIWHHHVERHRLDGPAVIFLDGQKEWWVNGVRHRVDGPALMWGDGSGSWYLNGEFIKRNVRRKVKSYE